MPCAPTSLGFDACLSAWKRPSYSLANEICETRSLGNKSLCDLKLLCWRFARYLAPEAVEYVDQSDQKSACDSFFPLRDSTPVRPFLTDVYALKCSKFGSANGGEDRRNPSSLQKLPNHLPIQGTHQRLSSTLAFFTVFLLKFATKARKLPSNLAGFRDSECCSIVCIPQQLATTTEDVTITNFTPQPT